MKDEFLIGNNIIEIMDMPPTTENEHLLWFEHLLSNHFKRINTHTTYDISADKIEGINKQEIASKLYVSKTLDN